VFGDYQ